MARYKNRRKPRLQIHEPIPDLYEAPAADLNKDSTAEAQEVLSMPEKGSVEHLYHSSARERAEGDAPSPSGLGALASYSSDEEEPHPGSDESEKMDTNALKLLWQAKRALALRRKEILDKHKEVLPEGPAEVGGASSKTGPLEQIGLPHDELLRPPSPSVPFAKDAAATTTDVGRVVDGFLDGLAECVRAEQLDPHLARDKRFLLSDMQRLAVQITTTFDLWKEAVRGTANNSVDGFMARLKSMWNEFVRMRAELTQRVPGVTEGDPWTTVGAFCDTRSQMEVPDGVSARQVSADASSELIGTKTADKETESDKRPETSQPGAGRLVTQDTIVKAPQILAARSPRPSRDLSAAESLALGHVHPSRRAMFEPPSASSEAAPSQLDPKSGHQEEGRQRLAGLASSRKYKPLMAKWRSVKEGLDQAHRDDEILDGSGEATGGEHVAVMERTALRRTAEWRQKYISSGEAAGNANFTVIPNDGWRERVAEKKRQREEQRVKDEMEKAAKRRKEEDDRAKAERKEIGDELALASKGLPSDWKAFWDPKHERVYYGNLVTKSRVWIKPESLSQG